MNPFDEILKNKRNVYYKEGVDEQSILQAEEALGLKFSDDYREYLVNYGLLSYGAHELTGICNSSRLNVVEATNREKIDNYNISDDMYLLEQIGVENLTIWQNSKGEILEVPFKESPRIIYYSLLDYIEKFDE